MELDLCSDARREWKSSGSRLRASKRRALRAGALGYVVKDAAGSDLVCAVRAVSSGKQYLSPSIAILFSGDCPNQAAVRSPLERLSAREREVLHRTVEGYSSAQIAVQMSLAPKTIDTYRS